MSLAGLALASGTGLVVHCMAADSQIITEKVSAECAAIAVQYTPVIQLWTSCAQLVWFFATRHMQPCHMVVQATGVTFPQVTKFWHGESYRCMGAGVRTKKVAFVGVKVKICA